MSIIYDYNRSEELLDLVYSRFPELIEHDIKIIFSDEIPPLIKKETEEINENDNFGGILNRDKTSIEIDGISGQYFPDTKTIKIYLLAFETIRNWYFNKTKFNDFIFQYQTFLKFVILHEIGHYWFYNMVQLDLVRAKKPGFFIDNLDMYSYKKYKRVYEWVAQMFALLCLNEQFEKDYIVKLYGSLKSTDPYFIFPKDANIPLSSALITFKKVVGTLYLNLEYISSDSLNSIFIPFDQVNIKDSTLNYFNNFMSVDIHDSNSYLDDIIDIFELWRNVNIYNL